MTGPTLLLVRAPLDTVRTALLSIGAHAQNRRSVAFDLADHLLLLDHDRDEFLTTVAVGGPKALSTASWLGHQLVDFGCPVDGLLPPLDSVSA
ncbi:MAG TPA: hypothetical protein VHO29_12675 [Marmoricola sp.]|nr:hypothetical protein [Marmoricola sp.]